MSLVTLGWLGLESVLGLVAGLRAHSVALIGWGLTSMVEALASLIVLWRFTGSRVFAGDAERKAQRAVALSFWLLAPYVVLHVAHDLAEGHRSAPSPLGIAVTTISLISMPVLGVAKRRLGARLASPATAGEGTQNLLCASLAAGVLIGLGFNTIGWWWVDPMVATVLAAVAAREGWRAWGGHVCRH
ncbi:cation transporter [Sinosporangium siamense]|uniref:cation transporter n=1 Tax=Sinosporangium siamense TaxID=1367973 RepID=UPI001EF2E956|nr:cation transporter [Sinosporangium siamense]